MSYRIRAGAVLLASAVIVPACDEELDVVRTPAGPAGSGVPVRGSERLAWDQAATSAAQIGQLGFRLYVDGSATNLSAVQCAQAAGPSGYPCSAALPQMSNGTHVLALATVLNGMESERSSPLTVNVGAGGLAIDRSAGAASQAPADSVVCANASTCFDVSLVLTLPTRISSPVSTADGRLWFIEGDRYVRLVSGGELLPEPALAVPHEGIRLTGLLADRSFGETGIMRVAQVDETSSDRRSMTVTSFQHAADRLVDAAVLIPELPLPPSRDPHVAQDSEGRIYVAVPSGGSSSRRDPYFGSILRFESDGRVPWSSGQRSPIWAGGFDQPTAIAFDPVDRRIWAAGAEGESLVMRVHLPAGHPVRTIPIGSAAPDANRPGDVVGLAAVGLRGTEIRRRMAPPGDGWPLSGPVDVNRLRGLARRVLGENEPVAIGAGAQGETYVVTRQEGSHSHSLFRISPQRAGVSSQR